MAKTDVVADETEVKENEKPEPTAAELAAAEKLAALEKRATEAEAESARLKSERAAETKRTHPKTGYTISSFPETEWTEAEAQTGLDRKAILANLNLKAGIESSTMATLESLESQYAVKDELQDALDADPLAPKFKAEAKKFMADIPGDLLKTPEGRKKWITKAIQFAKSGVKLPAGGRKPDAMDTKETGTVKDKIADKGFSLEEKEVIESHGRTLDDYEKLKNPYIPDSTVHRGGEDAPKFGPK